MAKEADDNLNLEPAATPELINAAVEAVKSQGLDVNPYSVAREAGLPPEVLFTNTELMDLVISARGDQATFSIDSQLTERCQELEGEMAKLLEINQEIYDRALEMEERVIQLEAKISDMEQESEQLTMQLQNSWHLGYKKGLNDGQSQETKANQRPMIDIELPKEEAPDSEVFAAKPLIDIELPGEETQPIKSMIDIVLPAEEKQSIKSMIDIELPKDEEKPSIKSMIDIELPKDEEKQSIKSMIDIELPAEEKQSIKSMIDIELPAEEKQSIKSMIDIELPPEEKQSIKSMIDIELPKDESPSQTDFSADEGRDTQDNPTIASDSELAAPGPVAQDQDPAAAQTYNDRVFNAVSDGFASGGLVESYGGMSWREVETIYQYSASGGAAGPNLVFEPLAPGQAVGARAAEQPESKGFDGQAAEEGATTAPPVTARSEEGNGGLAREEKAAPAGREETQPIPIARGEAQPIPSRSDTQPIFSLASTISDPTVPPILKADAAQPRSDLSAAASASPSATGSGGPATAPAASSTTSSTTSAAASAAAKPNPRSTFTNMRAKSLTGAEDPPMERTINQFLGDTSSYMDLDRVTMEPIDEAAPASLFTSGSGEDQQPAARPSQAETQTLAGAVQALAAEAKAKAEAKAEGTAAGSSAAQAAGSELHSAAPPPTGPSDAKWGKRDANATYDGLTAMENDSTTDVLDLEKLDIFEGLEDIDELSQIEVIEDVVLPGTPGSEDSSAKKSRYKSSEHIPVVSSDDLHDLIKSRIKKAEEPHEAPRVDGFVSHSSSDKGAVAGTASTSSTTGVNAASGAAAAAGTAGGPAATPGADPSTPPPVPSVKELEALRQGARNKFVGGKAATGSPIAGAAATGGDSPIGAANAHVPTASANSRTVPPEIRKACMILGVRPEDLTLKEVHEKWKSQIAAPGAHPDQGGDTESAIYLNTAKDTLVKWINDQAPKLGKQFRKKDEK